MNQFNIVLRLAWRNLWRNHKRTLIMIAAIVIGAWSMIFMTALMRGMVDDMIADGISVLPGHVQIHHPDYRDDPTIANVIAPPSGELLEALDDPEVVAWATRVRVPAVISSERDTRGVTLIGIEPERERDISFVAGDLAEGVFLTSRDDRGLILGRRLVERLETDLGKRVVIMSQDQANEIADRGFRIVGIFESSLALYEESFVFAGEAVIQELLGVGDAVSEVAILGHDYRDVGDLTRLIEDAADDGVEVLPWNEIDTYLGSMLAMMDGFVIVFIVVVFLALSFGLVNTLVMAVFERVREIGLMLALGMTPRSILGQIVTESVLLLIIGLAIGNVAAIATIEPLKGGIDVSIVGEGMEMMGASSVLYPALYLKDIVMANAIVIVLGFLASLSPAWRASQYDPIRAITKV
ncbi:MAG: FtsX-like permease family protein [Thermoanaerobaculales bacterium]|jgi:ABC-type lipoprotein release transport system permease subunit|nr:FtsX-like permease family protein [Thermoanaerobaculales bacterium]